MRYCPSLTPFLIPITTVLMFFNVGCADRAPTREFVLQADRLHQAVLGGATPLDSDLNEYFQHVGRRLIDGAKLTASGRASAPIYDRFEWHLVDCNTINVVTTGGTHVYIYNGLFQACESEEEVAAAVAHALAHAIRLDLEQTKMRPSPDRPIPSVEWDFVLNRYNIDQENQAHELAYKIYMRAGWNPARFERLFVRLADRYTSTPAPDRSSLQTRIASSRVFVTTENDAKWRKPNVADRDTFAALRQKASALREPAPPTPAVILLRAFPNCILPYDAGDQKAAQEMLRPPPIPRTQLEPS